MQAKYVVASKKNRTIRSFDKAGSVAAFMLGRQFSEWCIYQRQDDLPADVHLCERLLTLKEKTMLSPDAVTSQSFQDERDAHDQANPTALK